MPITKQSRLQIFNQFKSKGASADDLAYLEKALDDSNPLGNQFEQMFAARSEMSRVLNEQAAEKQRVEQERAALNAWKAQQEQNIVAMNAEANRKVTEAATMAKIAVDKLTGAAQRARAGEELTFADLSIDTSLSAFAATAGTGNGNFSQSFQQQPAAQQYQQYQQPQAQQQQTPAQAQPAISAQEFANNLIKEIGALEDLKYKHQMLFGQPLDAASLITMAQQQQRPITELYSEIYNPEAKREEVAKSEFERKVQEAVDVKMKEFTLNIDPSGAASSLALLGAMENKNRSAALQNLGPNNTALQLDPTFANRMGQVQQQQQQQQASTQGAAMGQLSPQQQGQNSYTSLQDMDTFVADMMAGIQENRTAKSGTQVLT